MKLGLDAFAPTGTDKLLRREGHSIILPSSLRRDGDVWMEEMFERGAEIVLSRDTKLLELVPVVIPPKGVAAAALSKWCCAVATIMAPLAEDERWDVAEVLSWTYSGAGLADRPPVDPSRFHAAEPNAERDAYLERYGSPSRGAPLGALGVAIERAGIGGNQ